MDDSIGLTVDYIRFGNVGIIGTTLGDTWAGFLPAL